MSDIFSEVNADLRKDRMHSIWDKYGYYILAALAAIIIGVAANVGYGALNRSANEEASARYGALLATQPTQDALAAFSAAENNGYGALAAFTSALQYAEAGKMREALGVFDTLTIRRDLPESLRDYARLQAAIILVDSAQMNIDDISARLAPLLVEGQGFRFMARDIMALAFVKTGNNDRARTLYEEQSNDEAASRFARERADIMLNKLIK